ncbi:MAG: hypothetical protein H0T99_01570 [Geodermatophilaceae bacterium]|nr:hypothetical protein [Geodermatophilaceae bacterium]
MYAKANNQVLNGTCGTDTFFVGRYTGVTIHAGAGNDDVRGGSNPGTTTDTLIGGSQSDFLYGGPATTTSRGRAGLITCSERAATTPSTL